MNAGWITVLAKRKPLAALVFIGIRTAGVVRGWILKQYLVFVWGASIGKRLTCFGWPRNIFLFGNCEIGDNVHIGPYAYLQSGLKATLKIDSSTCIGAFATIASEESIVIGKDVMIAECVSIRDCDHKFEDLTRPMHGQGMKCAPVVIGKDVWIGRGVAILRGSIVSDGCIVGANAVVKGTLAPYTIAAGVPARIVRERAPRLEG